LGRNTQQSSIIPAEQGVVAVAGSSRAVFGTIPSIGVEGGC
jgi:hypothetical protein